jgi:hypothetical protein
VATGFLCAGTAATLIFFYGFYEWYTDRPHSANRPPCSLLQWLDHSWNGGSIYDNSWLVVVVMVIYAIRAVLRMRNEPITVARGGAAWLLSGIVLWFLSVRVSQPFLAGISLPLVIMGAVHFTCGWRRARHAVLPLVLFAFVIPLPGAEKLANWLGNHSDKLAQSFLQRLPDEWLSSFFLWSRNVSGCGGSFQDLPFLLFAGFIFAMEVPSTPTGRFLFTLLAPVMIFFSHTVLRAVECLNPDMGWFIAWHWHYPFLLQLVYLLLPLSLFHLFGKALCRTFHRRLVAAA